MGRPAANLVICLLIQLLGATDDVDHAAVVSPSRGHSVKHFG